jgi:transposase-like protein
MSPRKLTAADKKAIVSTYRSSGESTTALADRYGVSTSTISRLLKNNIPEEEYEVLISDKRTQRGDSEEENILAPQADLEDDTTSEVVVDLPSDIPRLRITTNPTSSRRVRRRSSASEDEEKLAQVTKSVSLKPITRAQKYSLEAPLIEALITFDQETGAEAPAATLPPTAPNVTTSYFDQTPPQTPVPKVIISRAISTVSRSAKNLDVFPEDDMPQDLSMVASLFGEEMCDLLDDDDDLLEEEGWSERVIPTLVAPEMQVLPLASATLPRTCYIVVDKFAELVACPLREFMELGMVSDDSPQNTLPVFDNQRVAKRFSSSRNQRVIKVPDSGVFYKTIDHLLAKGISLMLVDGRIYSLR